jgi:starch synthase
MYSLKYGTVPIVRETGGLADTIVGFGGPPAESAAANGFSFQEYSPLALSETLRRACDLFRLQPEQWKNLVETGMRQDWSWQRSAKKYVELYLKAATRTGMSKME